MGDVPPRPGDDDRERRWAEVRRRMEAASDLLALQGSVATRRTAAGARVASVRFVETIEGRRVQRAIYLGADGVLIRRAGALIGQYRERERWAREVEQAARFVAACGALVRRMPSTSHRRSARLGAPRAGAPGSRERALSWSKEVPVMESKSRPWTSASVSGPLSPRGEGAT